MISAIPFLLSFLLLLVIYLIVDFLFTKLKQVWSVLMVLYKFYSNKLHLYLKQTSAYKKFDEMKLSVSR